MSFKWSLIVSADTAWLLDGSDKRIDSRKNRTPDNSLKRSMELSRHYIVCRCKGDSAQCDIPYRRTRMAAFCNDDIRPFLQLVYDEVRRALHYEEEALIDENSAEFHFRRLDWAGAAINSMCRHALDVIGNHADDEEEELLSDLEQISRELWSIR